MKATILVKKEVDIFRLDVNAGIRYPEDTSVNGIEDTDGQLMPFLEDGRWTPEINFDSGQIEGWPVGTTANVCYIVCDDGVYELFDNDVNIIKSFEGYVPNCLAPKENGYGDYIIMDIDENGFIKDWNPTIEGFDLVEEED